MDSIYQDIWDADQNENGIQAIFDNQTGDESRGFVKVNSNLQQSNKDSKVLTDLHLPESKMTTYRQGLKLFDNYALRERDQEIETAEERTEVHSFVDSIIDTAPMQVAREYIAKNTRTSLTRQRWYNTIMEMWFRKFSMGGDPHLSGFEHVVIGEQQESKVQGYHFWYKYYLDDGFAREQDGQYDHSFPALRDDRIEYHGSKQTGDQQQYPESVTISYRWFAPDYERHALRPLFKKIGGFFVGCSLEGLLAMGTVRGHLGINAPNHAIINGAEYNLKLYHSDNRQHIRTFYPVFLRGVGTVDSKEDRPPSDGIRKVAIPSGIRIVAALVNPIGDDVGLETVTIINTTKVTITLNNWSVVDKNEERSNFSIGNIQSGDTHRINLDGKNAQLSNKGGIIKLLNDKGQMVHIVSYNREQVKEQGHTILF